MEAERRPVTPVNGGLVKVRKGLLRRATTKTTIAMAKSTKTSHRLVPTIAEQGHRPVVPENGTLATRRDNGLATTTAARALKHVQTTHGARATRRVRGLVQTPVVVERKRATTMHGEPVRCAHRPKPATTKTTIATAKSMTD